VVDAICQLASFDTLQKRLPADRLIQMAGTDKIVSVAKAD
jgi:hypothetical protein